MDIKVKEVILGRSRARGYVAFDGNNSPQYFIDVDRVNYVATFVDLNTLISETETNIDTIPFYNENQFDFIEILDTVNRDDEDAYATTYPGLIDTDWTFWGPVTKCDRNATWDTSDPFNPRCVRLCKKWKVRFFLRFNTMPEYQDAEGECI